MTAGRERCSMSACCIVAHQTGRTTKRAGVVARSGPNRIGGGSDGPLRIDVAGVQAGIGLLHQGFGGEARFPRERRQSSAAAVVDALVIGPRRAEKIGRLLREWPMRRRVDATGRGTTARRMGAARLRGRRRWRRARLHCRRGDRWRCSRGCPRDGGRNRGCAGRG